MRLFLVIAIASWGCVRSATFECASADQCTRDGVQGRCESVSYCSFPDGTCASGQRFGDYAGTYTNQCVGDGGPPDGPTDGRSGLGCPVGYTALPGVPNRLYRTLLPAASWTNLRTACSAEGANVYLAIPDDMTELSALLTLAGADVWVGIDDQTIEGTFQTVLGATPTYLPWGPGEPDNIGNKDCVQALAASSLLATLSCGTQRIAVCECEP
jgi:hypothetical protein